MGLAATQSFKHLHRYVNRALAPIQPGARRDGVTCTLFGVTPGKASELNSEHRSEAGVAYRTGFGSMIHGSIEDALQSTPVSEHAGAVQLVLTSPPFPLNRKKKYGNKDGQAYIDWLADTCSLLGDLLTDDGSLVIEIGNAWEPGKPVMSTLALRALLEVVERSGFQLCQQFVCHNPARLPSPAQWVNIERIRVKDAFTHVWWMSRTDRPKANNRNILTEYSDAMRKLFTSGKYNAGSRPSEFHIGEQSFFTNNGGAIPPNALTQDHLSNFLTAANTSSNDDYLRYCREHEIEIHPARMHPGLVEFFIRFLTDEGDWVMDPFAGSNTTGATAEALGRHWLCVEQQSDYVEGSKGRFDNLSVLEAPPSGSRFSIVEASMADFEQVSRQNGK